MVHPARLTAETCKVAHKRPGVAEKAIGPERLTAEGAESSTVRRVYWRISQRVCTSVPVLADSGWLWTPIDHVRYADPVRGAPAARLLVIGAVNQWRV